MKATFFLPILAYATRLVKEGTDLAAEPIKAVGNVQPLPAFEEDTNKQIEDNAASCNGSKQIDYSCGLSALNCDCSLGCAGNLGAGTTGEYEGGSYAYTSAKNSQQPDKLYIVDAVSCSDETSTANEDYIRQDVGQHTFTISGSITVGEQYESSQNNCRQGREKANGCAHKEQKICLVDNVPCPVDVPCVCA